MLLSSHGESVVIASRLNCFHQSPARSFCPPSSSTSSTSLKMASARSVNPSLPAVSQSCSEVGLELGVLKDELTDQLLIVALL